MWGVGFDTSHKPHIVNYCVSVDNGRLWGVRYCFHFSVFFMVYEWLAKGYGIGYSKPIVCRFGKVEICKRCIEVKLLHNWKYSSRKSEFLGFYRYLRHVRLEFCLSLFRNTKISENSGMTKYWTTLCFPGIYKVFYNSAAELRINKQLKSCQITFVVMRYCFAK